MPNQNNSRGTKTSADWGEKGAGKEKFSHHKGPENDSWITQSECRRGFTVGNDPDEKKPKNGNGGSHERDLLGVGYPFTIHPFTTRPGNGRIGREDEKRDKAKTSRSGKSKQLGGNGSVEGWQLATKGSEWKKGIGGRQKGKRQRSPNVRYSIKGLNVSTGPPSTDPQENRRDGK